MIVGLRAITLINEMFIKKIKHKSPIFNHQKDSHYEMFLT